MAESLSSIQMAHFRQSFDVLDKDQDGRISPEDLLKVMTSLGEEKFSLDECKKLVSAHDSIGDGTIDFVEFLTIVATTNKDAAKSSKVLSEDDDEKNAREVFMKFTGGGDVLTKEAFGDIARIMRESWAHAGDGHEQITATFNALSGGASSITFQQFKTAIDVI